MNRLSTFIYHAVHTNGFAADAAYAVGYHVQHAFRRIRNWRATVNPVGPEAMWDYRGLIPAAGLVVGVTNICNAKCTFCAYPKAVETKNLQGGVMPLSLFKKIVDEWAELGGDFVNLTHTVGDPLVDPGLADKVGYALGEGKMKSVCLTTNGILLNRNDTYRRLVDLGTTVIFISTQGTDRELYEKVYGVDQYDEVLSGVRNLLEYNRSKGEPTSIVIRFRNAQKPSEIVRSKDFIESIKPYLSQKVRFNFTVEFDNWGGLITEADVSGAMRLRTSEKRVDLPCKFLFGFLIRYDGSVRLCGCRFKRTDMDDMVVGNVRQQSLMEISHSDRAWKIVKGFYSGVRPESCGGCTFYAPVDRKWLRERAALSSLRLPSSQALHPAGRTKPQPELTK